MTQKSPSKYPIYEVTVDWDGNLRESQICSVGIYATKLLAEKALKRLKRKSWQKAWIKELNVFTS